MREALSDRGQIFAFLSVLSSSLRFSEAPSFPPLSEPLSFLRSLPWQKIGEELLSFLLFSFALAQALASRLWQKRGSLAPLLRSLASALEALASSLPEPLSSSAPRALLIEALTEKGEAPALLKKASRSALLKKAQKLGLLR